MAVEDFYKKYNGLMAADFPEASRHLTYEQLIHLMSPFVLRLPKKVFYQARAVIKTIYKISREYPEQDNILQEKIKKFCPPKIKNSSVLMAYDFHLFENDLKLIEINTNASGFMLSDLSQRAHGFPSSLPSLQRSFCEEMRGSKNVSIIDHSPQEQRMYVEFLIYQEWFKSWGLFSTISDFRDFIWDGHRLLRDSHPVDFIYNRYCDFLLEEKASKHLSLAYKRGDIVFSPQPLEYLLLADKQRLVDWLTPAFQAHLSKGEKEILQRVLIHSWEALSFESPEELWRFRKKFFFKPKNSYGSRSTYRGKSISKKNFERAIRENFLVQDFIPPDQVNFNGTPWKYDLRFYTFKDQVQQCVARIYRGQLTNFKELHGGFTAVQFI